MEKNGVGAAVAEALAILRPSVAIEEVSTTQVTKVLMTDRIVLLLEQHELTIPPNCYIGREMRNFRQTDKGKREAASGHHDDAVMALALACQAGATHRPLDSSWIAMA